MYDKIVIGGDLSLNTKIEGDAELSIPVDGDPGYHIPLLPDAYAGEYHITPSDEVQVIPMQFMMASQNVTIDAIPSNYGLISWNGSVLTVS